MSARPNLMTERAKFTATAARLSEVWAAALVVLFLVLTFTGVWTWQYRRAVIHQHEALEASYEPTRRLTHANRTVTAEAKSLVTREHAALTLSRRRPVASLLGVATAAVAATEGAAYLESIHYGAGPVASPGGAAPWTMTLHVTADEAFDVSQLVDALERPPVRMVKILSSAPAAEDADRKSYVLECEL